MQPLQWQVTQRMNPESRKENRLKALLFLINMSPIACLRKIPIGDERSNRKALE
jgi:hypothetical protein